MAPEQIPMRHLAAMEETEQTAARTHQRGYRTGEGESQRGQWLRSMVERQYRPHKTGIFQKIL